MLLGGNLPCQIRGTLDAKHLRRLEDGTHLWLCHDCHGKTS